MKYRIIFYRPALDKHWIDDIISLGTKFCNWNTPRASHVEVWMGRENGGQFDCRVRSSYVFGNIQGDEDEYHETKYFGKMFTSTMRGDYNGTVIRDANKILKNPNRWFYYELECDDADFELALHWAENACRDNKGYAKKTLLKFIGLNCIDKNRNICSQVCHKFAVLCGNLEQPPKIPSPRRLIKWLEKAGYKPVELKG